jgi:hypothetical protein
MIADIRQQILKRADNIESAWKNRNRFEYVLVMFSHRESGVGSRAYLQLGADARILLERGPYNKVDETELTARNVRFGAVHHRRDRHAERALLVALRSE